MGCRLWSRTESDTTEAMQQPIIHGALRFYSDMHCGTLKEREAAGASKGGSRLLTNHMGSTVTQE